MEKLRTAGRRARMVGGALVLGVVAVSGQAPPQQRVDIDALKAKIDGGATMLLIDVREDYEVESGSMPGSIHIPLGELQERMADIPKDVRLVSF
jgi:predicted sulfurtransferase